MTTCDNINLNQILMNCGGHQGLYLGKKWERECTKLTRYREHLTFNIKCLKNNLIPISLTVKPINNLHISKQAAYKCSIQYLKSRIIQTRLKIKNISITCNKLCNNLNKIYSKQVIAILNKRINKTCNTVKYKYRNSQKVKFYNLLKMIHFNNFFVCFIDSEDNY